MDSHTVSGFRVGYKVAVVIWFYWLAFISDALRVLVFEQHGCMPQQIKRAAQTIGCFIKRDAYRGAAQGEQG